MCSLHQLRAYRCRDSRSWSHELILGWFSQSEFPSLLKLRFDVTPSRVIAQECVRSIGAELVVLCLDYCEDMLNRDWPIMLSLLSSF